MRLIELGRFSAVDDAGKRYVITQYRGGSASDEIRDDRMSADPVIFHPWFETAHGDPVEQLTEDTFLILQLNKTVRKV
jgi:hypothetical protein